MLSSAREQKAVQRELMRHCQDEGSRRMGGDVADRVGPFDVEALERGWRCQSEDPGALHFSKHELRSRPIPSSEGCFRSSTGTTCYVQDDRRGPASGVDQASAIMMRWRMSTVEFRLLPASRRW